MYSIVAIHPFGCNTTINCIHHSTCSLACCGLFYPLAEDCGCFEWFFVSVAYKVNNLTIFSETSANNLWHTGRIFSCLSVALCTVWVRGNGTWRGSGQSLRSIPTLPPRNGLRCVASAVLRMSEDVLMNNCVRHIIFQHIKKDIHDQSLELPKI